MNQKGAYLKRLSCCAFKLLFLHLFFYLVNTDPLFHIFKCTYVDPLHVTYDHPRSLQTPILWSHGLADRTVLFEAGQAGPPFLEQAGMSCEFKVISVLCRAFLLLSELYPTF